MAIKKSELYSSLWASCDLLRGGMDASQYKDYVLVMLFVKYVSDKYEGQKYGDIEVPEGASFKDMVALKGQPDIGDLINKRIIAPLAKANSLPEADFPDFADSNKLGSGKEMVERLTDLIAIFENPALDFSKNRADGDDLLGDAYEYLMRHFATESGKSKGQFYTPAEVSRIVAQVIGIKRAKTTRSTAVYDPTCGSGSLLLKVADAAPTPVTLYGQEKDVATAGLARMNMILHNHATAEIKGGASTLADPHFRDGSALKTFDFVIANPPFSDKRWTTGFTPSNDTFRRFSFGVPPAKQGDFAYLLHIIASLKSTGKGACILPHGVLFRGNAEGAIRKNLIQRGYIKGIVGLPANLFYGTGIPACIVVLDKEGATDRKGIFMINASKGFMKDGPKNRLRDQDIHRIVDAFTRQAEIEKYSRFVKIEEIEKNDFNLNIPRYIDSSELEDLQDLDGHLKGGTPERDIDALEPYWTVCPGLRPTLYKSMRPGYVELRVNQVEIRTTILDHPEFKSFVSKVRAHFEDWRNEAAKELKALGKDMHPKDEIAQLSESLLKHFHGLDLIDPYAVYQHLMDYWASTMQDDCYLVAAEGWKAEVELILNKKGKASGRTCDLIPKELVIARYFQAEQDRIGEHQAKLDTVSAELEEMEAENSGDEGVFSDLDKVNLGTVKAHLKALAKEPEGLMPEEIEVLKRYLELAGEEQAVKQWLKSALADLDQKLLAKYKAMTEQEVKVLVVNDKWLATIGGAVQGEVDRLSQALNQRVRQLAERYGTPLPQLTDEVAMLASSVDEHLKKMGVVWK